MENDIEKLSTLPIPKKRGVFTRALFFLGGVLIPAVALAVELTTRLCSMVLVNPVPGPVYALLIATVPIANFFAARAIKRSKTDFSQLLAGMLGIGTGTCIVYTILFLPMTPTLVILAPFSLFTVIPFIFVVLAFSPLIGLVISPWNLRALNRLSTNNLYWIFSPALIMAVLAIAILETPRTVTRVALEQLSKSPDDRNAMQLLNTLGSEELVLKAAYNADLDNPWEHADIDFVGWLKPSQHSGRFFARFDDFSAHSTVINPLVAKRVYFQLTGKAFNSAARPTSFWNKPVFTFGPSSASLASNTINGKIAGLSLAESKLDTSVDGDSALAYTEWSLVLRNDSESRQEARAELILPPGAVISRASLVVNGTEREAVFAADTKVKEAYANVVRSMRDPLLVTSAGKDRIHIRCFPVPPNGGEMRLRLGITSPLNLNSEIEGVFLTPYFSDRNFEYGAKLRHSLWVESRHRLHSNLPVLSVSEPQAGLYSVRGELNPTHTGLSALQIKVERNSTNGSWTEDGPGNYVVQTIERITQAPLSQVVFVIDGSSSIAKAASKIATSLVDLPSGFKTALIIAGPDLPAHNPTLEVATPEILERLANRIARYHYSGGNDNNPALKQAWEISTSQPAAAIIWIHGPQPVSFPSQDELIRVIKRKPSSTKIISLQLTTGPNLLLSQQMIASLVEESRISEPALLALSPVKALLTPSESLVVKRRACNGLDFCTVGRRTSEHLARLWAAEEVERLLRLPSADSANQALDLASRFRIVTQVSGAVVLERDSDYVAAGLAAAPASTPANHIPTIPEPEQWALIVSATLLLLIFVIQQRRRGYAV